jgi:hypothetical protein
MSSHRLPPNMTRDLKAHRFPQAIVKTNASDNMKEMKRRENLDDAEKATVMFSLAPLQGDMGDAKLLLADGDPAYILRDPLGHAVPMNEQRTFTNMNNAMAVNTLLNGFPGTPEQIEALIEPVGWIEMGNEENRSAEINLIRGGSSTILYNGEAPARQNAYLILTVPNRDQANVMKSDKASHARGSEGAVPLMYAEYDPRKTSFLSAEKLYRIFNLGKEPGQHAFGKRAETEARSLVSALAKLSTMISKKPTRDDDILNLIKTAVERPTTKEGVEFVSTLNTLIQGLASFRRDKERFIVCKTHHGATNGSYVAVDHGRYSF